MKTLTVLALLFASFMALAAPEDAQAVKIEASSFDCMLDMSPVRGFYVDNLIEGKLDETLAVASASTGEYPPGSVVQLVPTEVMVKHAKGVSPATRDWEFFELAVSPEGTQIGKRGFTDVVNRFGGNCLGCHAKARTEFDMICETGHGCDPIPLTPQVAALLQKTDARCGGRYTPTPEEMNILKALAAQLSGQ